MSLTLISKDRKGVFTNPIARAKSSPHVGGFSALVTDHTPLGALVNGPGFIPHPDMFRLEIKASIRYYIRHLSITTIV